VALLLQVVSASLGCVQSDDRGEAALSPRRSALLDNPDACAPRTPVARPPSSSQHGLVYDIQRGVVLLQILAPDFNSAELYELNVGTGQWSHVNPNGPLPDPRTSAGFAYDRRTGKSVLFGGKSRTTGFTAHDVWEWDGCGWTDRTPAALPATWPSARWAPATTYDFASQRVIMTSGFQADITNQTPDPAPADSTVFEWDSDVGTFVVRPPAGTPPWARGGAALIGDPFNQVVYLMGGSNTYGWQFIEADSGVYVWNGTAGSWSRREPTAHPVPPVYAPAWRLLAGAYFDVPARRAVITGGMWSSVEDRSSYAMYDPDTNAFSVINGPLSNYEVYNRLWSPIAYDDVRNIAVQFGGVGAIPMNDPGGYILKESDGLRGPFADTRYFLSGGQVVDRLPPGTPCAAGSACESGLCVDGVCCTSECPGGNNGCQACSVAAGGSADGICTAVVAPRPCADDGNVCTLDFCDGNSTTCQHSPGNGGLPCRTAGACGIAAACDGVSADCPANGFKPEGKICSNVDACESAQFCSGLSEACPAGTTLPPENCKPVTSNDTTIGFFGWSDDRPPEQNPVGSVQLTFYGLGQGGTVTVVPSDDGPTLPPGFQTSGGTAPRYWNIETSATFESLTICIRYGDDWFTDGYESLLQLWHFHGSASEDRTIYREPNGNLICANVTSLSPFALVLPLDTAPPILPDLPDVTAYATSTAGAVVAYTIPTATDALDGSPSVDCTPASGTTFAPGKTTVTCTAADAVGNAAAKTFTVWVKFQAPIDGTFFLQPINPDGSSLFKRGSTIPVKFKLQGGSAGIADLAGHLAVAKVSNGVIGNYLEAISTAAADGGDVFRYDAGAKQYIFNLSTKAMTAGTWSLSVDLGDRVEHTVNVSLR